MCTFSQFAENAKKTSSIDALMEELRVANPNLSFEKAWVKSPDGQKEAVIVISVNGLEHLAKMTSGVDGVSPKRNTQKTQSHNYFETDDGEKLASYVLI